MDEALKKSGDYPNIAMPPGKRVHAATGEPVEIPASARVDGGTCKPTPDGTCESCGETVARAWETVMLFDGAVEYRPTRFYNYCPGCGRKVVKR